MRNNSLRTNKSIRVVLVFAFFLLQSNFIYAQSTYMNALPHGYSIVNGTVVVNYLGHHSHTLDITASNNSIINWNSFNIGSKSIVDFIQPNSSSVVLNRVVGIDPSSIYGELNANGRVFIVNPNGVFFGPGSQINVNGLLASTLGISNADFLAGNYNFTQKGKNASIINQGNIHVANGGYVLLLSDAVNNSGVIVAKLGRVILAAGEKMTVALDDNSDICVTINDAVNHNVFGPDGAKITQAIQNSGSIIANGGTILLNAKILNGIFDNAINNAGVIQANSIVNRNGSIELQAVGGGITDTKNSLISGGSLTMNATGGIGTDHTAINTKVSTINANVSGRGSINIDNISSKTVTLEQVTTRGGNITVNANGTMDADYVNSHGGNIDLKARKNIDGSYIYGRNIGLTAGKSIDVSDVYGKNIDLKAKKDITTTYIYGRNIDLTAGRDIDAYSIYGKNIDFTAGWSIDTSDIYGKNIDITARKNITGGYIYGKNIDIAAGKNIDLSDVYGKNIDLRAKKDITVTDIYGRNVDLTGGRNVDAYSIYGRNIDLTAGWNIDTSDIYGKNIDITARKNITGGYIYGKNIDIVAGKNIDVSDVYGKNVDLKAKKDITTTYIYGRNIDLTAGRDIDAYSIYGKNIDFTAGWNIDTSDIYGRNIDLTAGRNLDAYGIYGRNIGLRAGKDIIATDVYGRNIDLTARKNIIVGIVDAGTGNAHLTARDGSILGLDEYSLITGDTIDLSAGKDIGSALNYIISNSNFLNVRARGDVYLYTGNVEIKDLKVGGLADLLTGNVILDKVSTGGDFTLEAYSGNITFNGTVQSTGGAVDLLSDHGNINSDPGSNVIANADSFFSTPNGTIGVFGPVHVDINGHLILDIGTKVGGRFGTSGILTGEVNGPNGIPLVLPSSLFSPLYPPGNVFFNGVRIWPSESTFALSQASSGLLVHFVFPTAELLKLNQVNTFDPLTSSDQSGGLFLYHPLIDVDSGALDHEFQLDEGAYDFIDGQIGKKHK